MELYIARQPIFDHNKSVAGYELLHRESFSRNEYLESDGESASSRVISTAFLTLGLERLTSGKLAFVNFTGDLIKNGVASLLPKDQLVVEVLETIAPTRDVVAACVQLKKEGYRLALDDYVLNPVFSELADLADIIKVDFRQASADEQRRIPIVHSGREFLAEKVETEEEFTRASGLGYSLFQGFFF